MKEVKPIIVEKGQYKNLDLRETFKDNEDFVILEKGDFAEGMKLQGKNRQTGQAYDYYSCRAKAGEDEVSFLLYEQDHERFAAIEVGQKFKMSINKEMYQDKKGIDRVRKWYSFEPVA